MVRHATNVKLSKWIARVIKCLIAMIPLRFEMTGFLPAGVIPKIVWRDRHYRDMAQKRRRTVAKP
jgi:hypothetical protein